MVTDIVPVIFRTEVMTEKTKDLYRQIINQFLVELKIQPNQLKGRVEIIALKFAKDLDMSKFVNLKKLEGATLNKNFTMPFGITEPQLVRCFITDNNNFGLDLQQDFGVISHEMAHWILIHLRPSQRAKLRNDDRRSGYKKGTTLDVHTQEVHDRVTEGRFYSLIVKGNLVYELTKKQSIIVRCIDLRDFLN